MKHLKKVTRFAWDIHQNLSDLVNELFWPTLPRKLQLLYLVCHTATFYNLRPFWSDSYHSVIRFHPLFGRSGRYEINAVTSGVYISRPSLPLSFFTSTTKMSHENISKVEGDPLSLGSQALDTAAKTVQVIVCWARNILRTQNFDPLNSICAFLHGYHSYADNPGRAVSTYHYCAHLNQGIPPCLRV